MQQADRQAPHANPRVETKPFVVPARNPSHARRRCVPRARLLAPCALPLLLALAGLATAGDTLQRIRDRGVLRCGVSMEIPGLGYRDRDGVLRGFDVDFCRALAAGLLGSDRHARPIPLSAPERFPALLAGRVDVISGNTTWTLEREAGLDVAFIGPLYLDQQRLIVRRSDRIRALADLAGKLVCIERSTTHVEHLRRHFATAGEAYEPVLFDSFDDSRKAFAAGRCSALTADGVAVAGLRAREPALFELLDDVLSVEPIGAVVRSGDEKFRRAAQWIFFVLIGAENEGISRKDARGFLAAGADVDVVLLGDTHRYATALGLDARWAERSVAAAGNYGEIYERNLGQRSSLHLPRGPNRPARLGGLLFSPPLR
jgi:general L-amino acid transport system substrate-binding protein